MSILVGRDSLIAGHLGFARGVARRKAWHRQVQSKDEREEMESDALLGLVQAAHRYCPKRQVPFKAFAALCIVRAIRDGRRRRQAKVPTVSLEALALTS